MAAVPALIAAGCGGGSRSVSTAPVALPPAPQKQQQAPPEPDTAVRTPAEQPAPEEKPSPLVSGDDVLLGFEARRYVNSAGLILSYRLFRPPDYDPKNDYPLIVYLHGSSGAGDDNRSQLTGSRRAGVALWISPESQHKYPAFVLAPQADPNLAPTWVRQWRASPRPDPARAEPLELVLEAIDELADELSIDERRVYLTGYSMGAFGTWIAISRYPEKFAAAVPVAGGGDPTHVGRTKSAVWAFHGERDRVVPVRRSREMIQALKKAGRKPKYTEYPNAGHDIWNRAFGEPDLADWLFQQRNR